MHIYICRFYVFVYTGCNKLTLEEAGDILRLLGNSASEVDKLSREERVTLVKQAANAPDGHSVLQGRLAKYAGSSPEPDAALLGCSNKSQISNAESAKEAARNAAFWRAPKAVRMSLMNDLREEVDYVLDAGIEMFQTLDELQPLQFLGAKASVASIGTILVVMFSGIAIISKEVFLSVEGG
jgi:hypothetical protein